MKIECIIKRKKGTIVKMDNPTITYKFLPESGNFEDPHVATVEDAGHARLFLRHDEAYRLHEGKAPDPLPEEEEVEALGSSLVTGENYTIKGGDTVSLQVIINMALDDSGLEVEDWNKLSDDYRGQRIQAVLDELKDVPPAQEQQPEQQKPQEQEAKEEQSAQETQPEQNTEANGAVNPDDFTRPQLADMFKKRFGRKPSTQMDKAAIARALSQDDE